MAVLVYSKPVVGNLRPAARELHLCGPLIYILSNRILLRVGCILMFIVNSEMKYIQHFPDCIGHTQVHVKTKIAGLFYYSQTSAIWVFSFGGCLEFIIYPNLRITLSLG